ncbi:MAG: hypothetical protein IJ612_03760 [Prevotella sp.]|nr:hypothetical protein [Prevotella sp.]
MERKDFEAVLKEHEQTIEDMRLSAHELHQSVNQTYGGGLPYGYHLDMVACNAAEHGHLVCASQSDVMPLLFGAYYHDSIEDARQTYNDVMSRASQYMNDDQARIATEIVYALTNDKGRTRAGRAGEKYYAGIRATAFAPFVKLCDRMANVAFSCSDTNPFNHRMKTVYGEEMDHFLEAIDPHSGDQRFSVPASMVALLKECLAD